MPSLSEILNISFKASLVSYSQPATTSDCASSIYRKMTPKTARTCQIQPEQNKRDWYAIGGRGLWHRLRHTVRDNNATRL